MMDSKQEVGLGTGLESDRCAVEIFCNTAPNIAVRGGTRGTSVSSERPTLSLQRLSNSIPWIAPFKSPSPYKFYMGSPHNVWGRGRDSVVGCVTRWKPAFVGIIFVCWNQYALSHSVYEPIAIQVLLDKVPPIWREMVGVRWSGVEISFRVKTSLLVLRQA